MLLGSKGLLPCFEKLNALSVPGGSQQMHQPAVQVLLGDACCPGTHSTGASVAGWAETSFPSNLKVGKNGKERDIDIVPEHCTSGNQILAMMVCSLKKCGNDAPSLQAAPASPGIHLAATAHSSPGIWGQLQFLPLLKVTGQH